MHPTCVPTDGSFRQILPGLLLYAETLTLSSHTNLWPLAHSTLELYTNHQQVGLLWNPPKTFFIVMKKKVSRFAQKGVNVLYDTAFPMPFVLSRTSWAPCSGRFRNIPHIIRTCHLSISMYSGSWRKRLKALDSDQAKTLWPATVQWFQYSRISLQRGLIYWSLSLCIEGEYCSGFV
jgi:hypothetical protein